MLVPKKARRKHHIPWSHQVDAVNLRPVSARVPVLLDTELSLQPVFYVLFFLVLLGIQPQALGMIGKHSLQSGTLSP